VTERSCRHHVALDSLRKVRLTTDETNRRDVPPGQRAPTSPCSNQKSMTNCMRVTGVFGARFARPSLFWPVVRTPSLRLTCPRRVDRVDCWWIMLAAAISGRRWSEAEPEAGYGGEAVSGAGGR